MKQNDLMAKVDQVIEAFLMKRPPGDTGNATLRSTKVSLQDSKFFANGPYQGFCPRSLKESRITYIAAYKLIYIYVYTYTYMYSYTYTYIRTCMHTHTYVHTNTYSSIRSSKHIIYMRSPTLSYVFLSLIGHPTTLSLPL